MSQIAQRVARRFMTRKATEAEDESILSNIEDALQLLEEASERLMERGEEFYNKGNNRKGNIRHDAGRALKREAERLRSSTGHLGFMLTY